MTDDFNWTLITSAGAKALTTITDSPGVIYGFETADLPQSLQRMRGVTSYYVSGYTLPHALKDGLTVAGEMLVARTDRDLTKNYQFVFAVSSDGVPFFKGPYYAFSGHHVKSGQVVSVSSLFGHTPFSRLGGGTQS